MARRKKIPRKSSKRSFTKSAIKTNPKNLRGGPMVGAISFLSFFMKSW